MQISMYRPNMRMRFFFACIGRRCRSHRMRSARSVSSLRAGVALAVSLVSGMTCVSCRRVGISPTLPQPLHP